MVTAKQKDKIRSDSRLRMRIALEIGVTERTILNWVNSNSKKLQAPVILKAINRLVQ